MSITDDHRFAFDVQGFLHLREALTADEVALYRTWIDDAKDVDIATLNADNPAGIQKQLNRPVSRIVDADVRFARFLDHPAVVPFLQEFLGDDYRHIDNDLYFTHPGYAGGHWHRGVRAHATGHVINGSFRCPMVKVFYCLTDVGPDQGAFVVVPGSHKAQYHIDMHRIDLPAQHIFDDVRAGDVIIFNEALLHNGRPNPSSTTRQTVIVNFGGADAGVWDGYAPKAETLAQVSERQRNIMANGNRAWSEAELVGA